MLHMVKKMGPLASILKMLPGVGNDLGDLSLAEKEMKKVRAIIQSMTREERAKPEILKASRKIRIAKGSGTDVSDVNRLLKQFEMMKSMMKMFSSGKMPNLGAMKNMGGGMPNMRNGRGKGRFPF